MSFVDTVNVILRRKNLYANILLNTYLRKVEFSLYSTYTRTYVCMY